MRPMPELKVTMMKVADLVPYANNARIHTHEQIDQLAESIELVGFNDPVGVWHNDDGETEIIEGHGRVLALKKLGIEDCPVIVLDHLSDPERRFYTHLHNKLTDNGTFDLAILEREFENMPEFDWDDFGFDFGDFEGLEYSPEAPKEFKEYGEDIETSHKCPMCGYEW
jgi:ParB-like chromosome segregation protein Spo0J